MSPITSVERVKKILQYLYIVLFHCTERWRQQLIGAEAWLLKSKYTPIQAKSPGSKHMGQNSMWPLHQNCKVHFITVSNLLFIQQDLKSSY